MICAPHVPKPLEACAFHTSSVQLEALPQWAAALQNLGHARRKLRKFPQALAAYERALALRPKDAAVLCAMGFTLHLMQRLREINLA